MHYSNFFRITTFILFLLLGCLSDALAANEGLDINKKESESSKNRLLRAVIDNDVEALRRIIDSGEELDSVGADGFSTPLIAAVSESHEDIVDILITAGANVNFSSSPDTSPIFLAVFNQDLPIIRRLLEAGANPNGPENSNAVPLADIAMSESPNMEIFELLLEYGADVNAKNAGGSTPLLYAAIKGHDRLILRLLREGADPCIKNNNGKSFRDFINKSPE